MIERPKFSYGGNWLTRFIAQCICDYQARTNVNKYHKQDHEKLKKEHHKLEQEFATLKGKYELLYADSHQKSLADYEAMRTQRDINDRLIADLCEQNLTIQKAVAMPEFTQIDQFEQLSGRIKVQNEQLMKGNKEAIDRVKLEYGLMTEHEWKIKFDKDFEADKRALIKELTKPQ